MSSTSETAPYDEEDEMLLPPMSRGEAMMRANTLKGQQRKTRTIDLIKDVEIGDFWRAPRQEQVRRMLARKDVHHVLQVDIGKVLGVSKGLVTRLK